MKYAYDSIYFPMLWNTVLWSTVKSAKLTLASRIRQMHMHKLSQDQRKEKVCVMATSISESFWVCYWVHVLNLSHLRCQQTIGLLNLFFFQASLPSCPCFCQHKLSCFLPELASRGVRQPWKANSREGKRRRVVA